MTISESVKSFRGQLEQQSQAQLERELTEAEKHGRKWLAELVRDIMVTRRTLAAAA